MKLSIIVPCYNEADNIDKIKSELFPVLDQLEGFEISPQEKITSLQIVFVDDGSKDNTWNALNTEIAASAPSRFEITLRKHPTNLGLGAAIRTGFEAANGDILLTTDSDGTYKFVTIPELLKCLAQGADIVTASPYHPQGEVVGVPAYRIFLSRGSSLLYRILLNWHIHTYTALYRAYRRRVVEAITFESNDYLAGTEIMVKAMLKGYQVVEYPAALHRRMFGVSKARLLKTIQSHLRFQFKLLLHRLQIRSMFLVVK